MNIAVAARASSEHPTGDQVKRGVRRPVLAAACWIYLVAVTALWLVMRQTGDRWWPGTFLLLAPRWPYAAPLLVLWPWVLAARRWWPASATAAATAVVLLPVMGCRLTLPGGPERGDLRLLTCNIHRQHLDAKVLEEYIATVQPDIVALQGWSAVHKQSLFTDGKWDIRVEGELLLASRHPIDSVTVLSLGADADISRGEQGVAAVFEIRAPNGLIHLINLHLASPHAGLNSLWTDGGGKLAGNLERRQHEMDALRAAADRVQGPLLVAGDFNTTSESPIFRGHWADFTDAFLDRGTGFGFTYVINHTQIRIDHVLADASWHFTRCWVGPDVGAAHRPLVADLSY